jgi:nucleoside-diphosphate-sugar epimerase
LGYRFETTKARFEETVEKIHAAQPEAIIYLCANMHVTKEQSEKDEIYNNTNVNMINEVIEALADDQQFIYLDVNELFDDEEGYLNEEYTSDAFHVLGKYYEDWVDWLCTKAIIQEVDDLESGD